MKKVLSKFNLGDAYEIQARVLPAMLIVMPAAVLVAQVALAKRGWLAMIGWGAGLEVVLAILASKIGHALGVRLQARLEQEWGGLPTHAWLRPSDQSHSDQQKEAWRKAVSDMSGLDVERAIQDNDEAEMDRVIADAIMGCRNKMKGADKAELVQTHNITFGFARNLAGMKWLALALCIVCAAVSVYGSLYHGFELAGTIIQLLFLVIAGAYAWLASGYVRHCAIRYAEFFYATVADMAGKKI